MPASWSDKVINMTAGVCHVISLSIVTKTPKKLHISDTRKLISKHVETCKNMSKHVQIKKSFRISEMCN